MANWIFLNNGFLQEPEANVHFKDLTLQRGYGIFDFFRLSGNKPLFLDNYLDRFYASADAMRLPVPLDRTAIKTAITALIERNNLPDSGIRLALTGGTSEDGFSIGRPAFLISQQTFTPPSAEQVTNGIKLFTYPYQRQLPQVKTTDYLMAVWLQPERVRQGADDILYHQNGLISECPRSNFFIVTSANTLVTPAKNILKGVTRGKVLEVAKQVFEVEERDIFLDELSTAKEAFITSTTKQVLPVKQIDQTVFPTNEISLSLFRLFRSAFC